MQLCYVDEAGCTGQLAHSHSPVQPLLVVGSVFIAESELQELTHGFLKLKGRYFSPLFPDDYSLLDRIQTEIKGADLRRDVRVGKRSPRRMAIGFLDDLFDLLVRLRVRLVARVWIKPIGAPINGTGLSTSSMQSLFQYFQEFLTSVNEKGCVIADSRSKTKNINVAHSVFTQKYQRMGDPYNRIVEMPTFGNSDNHAGLQVADLICSSLLFPIAAFSYCLGHVHSVHVDPAYSQLKERYGPQLRDRQFRYQDLASNWKGGITVSDPIQHRNSALMFK